MKNEKIAVELLKDKRCDYGTHYLLKDGSVHFETDNNNDIETFVFESENEILKVLKENFETLKEEGFLLFKKSNDGNPYIIETFAKR